MKRDVSRLGINSCRVVNGQWIRNHRRASQSGCESGDTLIEILVAITIFGLAGVALLGAFGVSIAGSAEHRSLATLDTVMKSFAEEATYQIQLSSSPYFTECATPSGTSTSTSSYVYYKNPPPPSPPSLPLNDYTPPANYSVQITSMSFWSPSSGSFKQYYSSSGGAVVSCPSGASAPQLITITATGPGKGSNFISNSISFVVQNPNFDSLSASLANG